MSDFTGLVGHVEYTNDNRLIEHAALRGYVEYVEETPQRRQVAAFSGYIEYEGDDATIPPDDTQVTVAGFLGYVEYAVEGRLSDHGGILGYVEYYEDADVGHYSGLCAYIEYAESEEGSTGILYGPVIQIM